MGDNHFNFNSMKQQTITLICGLLFFGITVSSKAQTAVLATGGNASGSGGTVNYSIGQTNSIAIEGTGGSANQGVQQPFEIYVLSVENHEVENINLVVYPNPAKTSITLQISAPIMENLSYSLYDITGRKIKTNLLLDDRTSIDMEALMAATYLLKISNESSIIKTIRIIKN